MDHAFGRAPELSLGVEEELLLVDGATLALAHASSDILPRVDAPEGRVYQDTFEAELELSSPIVRDAGEAIAALRALRVAVGAAGATTLGAGIHPDAAFGDVEHVDQPRYRAIAASLRGLLSRTPTAALHVHVAMPDPETAIRVCNGIRVHLPLLQALAANSPFWFGRDSGLASARAALFRAYPRAEIPREFASFEDWERTVTAVTEAGELADYSFLWWDARPHPRLGTVELRAMDSQSSLETVGGLAALVHGLVAAELEHPAAASAPTRDALAESSFRASRDGLGATLLHDGALRPLREVATSAIERARPQLRALGSDAPLEGVERILRDGAGADRQRMAYARAGMRALLEQLVAETAR
jgi:carboxylate-amine ligase